MATEKQKCPACQKPNLCGISQGEAQCWCFDLDLRLPLADASEACYCEACLQRIAAAGEEKSGKAD